MTDHYPSSTFSPLDKLKAVIKGLEAEDERLRSLTSRYQIRINRLLEAHLESTDDHEAETIWQERKHLIEILQATIKEQQPHSDQTHYMQSKT